MGNNSSTAMSPSKSGENEGNPESHAPIAESDSPREKKNQESSECGYRKRGACRERFIEWDKCVEEYVKNKEEHYMKKCFQLNSDLIQCMRTHSDYYAPILPPENAMEDNSSPANPNPSQPTAMSPSKSGQNEVDPELETPSSQTPNSESSDPQRENNDQESQKENLPEGEEEEECGFCLFMKGGGCRDPFIEWEKCVEEGEKNKEDIVEKCFEVTSALKNCMEANSDYYAPILQAEKAAEAAALKELEMEKEGKNSESKTVGDSQSSEKKEES